MVDNESQNETPSLSKKSQEINDMNNSQENQIKTTHTLNVTNDLFRKVSQNIYITKN